MQGSLCKKGRGEDRYELREITVVYKNKQKFSCFEIQSIEGQKLERMFER